MTCPCLFARSPTSGRAPHHDFSKLVCAFLHIWWCPYHDLSMLVCTLSCIWWRHAPTTSVSACLIVLPPLLVPPTTTFQCLLACFRTAATSGRAPTMTFQCLFARSCTSGGTNPPQRHFNVCLLVLAPTPTTTFQ